MDSKTFFIRDYKKFYIQTGVAAVDTKATYGLIAKSNPYPILPQPKSPYSNNWPDEDGEEEYLTNMYYESFEFKVEFYISCEPTISTAGVVTETAKEKMRDQIYEFFDAIEGREFLTYDEYSGLGFGGVRYAGYEEGDYLSRPKVVSYTNASSQTATITADVCRTTFTVTFKVNEPTSRKTLSNGVIVDLT